MAREALHVPGTSELKRVPRSATHLEWGLLAQRETKLECAPATDTSTVGFGMADLVKLAGDLETDAERLNRESRRLGSLVKLLNDRIQGRQSGVLPLGPAPRRVPWASPVFEFLGGVWRVIGFTIFFPPVWAAPFIHPLVGLLALAVVGAVGLWHARSRSRMWRWGAVADATIVQTGSGRASYKNWPMRIATGWQVRSESYTGTARRTVLSYLGDDGQTYNHVVKGAGYSEGVILYDTERPERSLGVEKFAFPLEPDYRGELRAQRLSWGGRFKMALAAIAVTYLALASTLPHLSHVATGSAGPHSSSHAH